ncbi:MAG: sigma-70 family RNA polymerase sigma factor [Paludisphaera borealis]|uniref:RNA polymerase sigma factor n=1 Tax=Paludisphaera borealis TaxID=1387353 RepID=UPI00283F3B4F|nr:sigma-70 family RNA polymerase sigma factor [Paludisphaera borealis]MDR3619944.1 sigma-70 family RNA polymerase sigma factor [Paludisphaera borealis]
MTEQPNDEELVRRARGGDVQAFGVLYDRTVRLVRAVAADAGPNLAEDVTHDAFLRAYRNLPSLRDPAKFSVWLIGIARMIVRERKRARRFEPLSVDTPQAFTNAEKIDDDTEELLLLVARLPEEERLAIRLYFLNERSIDETSKLLDRSKSGTYAVLQRAKARLAAWLRECGVSR